MYKQLLAQNEINNSNLICAVVASLTNHVDNKNSILNDNKLKVLLDSGASSSIVYKNRLPQAIAATLKRKQTPTVWTTNTGAQQTNKLHLRLS